MRRPCRVTTAALLLAVLGVLLPPPALADATRDNLLERALGIMRDAERAYNAGDVARARAEASRALQLIERAEALVPDDPETAFLGVQAAVFTGDRETGQKWLQRYATRTPFRDRDPNLYYASALVAHYLDDRPDRAILALERMQALSPTARAASRDVLYYAALILQGNRLVASEDREAAIRLYQTAALVARRSGRVAQEQAARANIGIALQRGDRYIEAGEIFDALRKESPDNVLWHWYTGLCLANQSRFADAVPLYRKVLGFLAAGKVPADHRELIEEVYLRLGNCYRNMAGGEADAEKRKELLQKALEATETYLRRQPGRAIGHFWLGTLLLEELDRPYDALAEFRKAQEADPVCDAALRSMVQVATRYEPPPGTDAATWAAWRAAWQKDLEEHAEERAAERRKREKQRPDGTDGCA
jgi:tetratricopeptide (TPR) repeat protein